MNHAIMFDLITIGDSLVDTFFIIDESTPSCHVDKKKKKLLLNYAEKIGIEKSTHAVGGNAANVAVGAKKLGTNAAIATEIGDDINGHVILDTLKKAKVDTSFVTIHENQESRYSVVLNYESERTILSYHPKRKYSLPTLPDTSWIYYTSLGKGFETLQKELVTYLDKHPHTHLAMNPGSYQFAHGLNAIKWLLPNTDLLIINKEEAMQLVKKPSKNIKYLLKSLTKHGVKTVVITDSTRGSYAANGTETLFMKPYPIAPKAKTGAGDAYTSGFLSAILLDKTLSVAMQWGTANAGGVIQQYGAQKGLLSKPALNTLIKTYPRIKPKTF